MFGRSVERRLHQRLETALNLFGIVSVILALCHADNPTADRDHNPEAAVSSSPSAFTAGQPRRISTKNTLYRSRLPATSRCSRRAAATAAPILTGRFEQRCFARHVGERQGWAALPHAPLKAPNRVSGLSGQEQQLIEISGNDLPLLYPAFTFPVAGLLSGHPVGENVA